MNEDAVYEISYGIVPLRKMDECWHLLLIKHHAGHWAFPKGHAEEGETPSQTAARELFEETGLKVTRFLNFTPMEEKYQFKHGKKKINKTVQYFLAEVEGQILLQAAEVIDYKWVKMEEAVKYVTFPESQRICQKVANFLTHNFTIS